MEIHFNIRKEFHFQWHNFVISDIFSRDTLERSYDLLVRSGELIEPKVPENLTNSKKKLLGYGEANKQQGKQILNSLIGQQKEGTVTSGSIGSNSGNITPFSNNIRKQLIVLTRVYLALISQPSSLKQTKRKPIKSQNKKQVEETASTLVQIGVKAGLPLLFTLIRRSWQRNDSELCTEVFW